MMPFKEAHLRRWQVAAAFVAITVAFVIAAGIATHASNQATEASEQANATAEKAARLARRNRILLNQQQDLLERQNKTDKIVAALRREQLSTLCREVERLKATTRDAIREARKRTSKIEYFRHHPAELREQILESRRQEARFKPKRCPPLPMAG